MIEDENPLMRPRIHVLLSVRFVIVCSVCCLALAPCRLTHILAANNKHLSIPDRDAAEECVKSVLRALEDKYYDPTFHGVDLKSRAKEAIDRVHKTHNLSEVYGVVAWLLEPLNDSHTIFIPPARPYDVEHG